MKLNRNSIFTGICVGNKDSGIAVWFSKERKLRYYAIANSWSLLSFIINSEMIVYGRR